MYKLISIRISPFCELARWVLEKQGIPYREECHAPILSLPFSWAANRGLNVPVMLAPDATVEVKDFLDYIDARARDDDRILPLDAAERKEAEQLIESLLTGLAISVRQYAYANMLPNRKVTSALMVVRVPWWEWAHGMHLCYGRLINGVQLPVLVQAIVQLPNLRRAPGRFRPLLYEGTFPDRLVVEFGAQA